MIARGAPEMDVVTDTVARVAGHEPASIEELLAREIYHPRMTPSRSGG